MEITSELCADCNHSRNEHNRFCHHEEISDDGDHLYCHKMCESFVEKASSFDRALAREIALVGLEEQHDRLEAGDYPGAWLEGHDEDNDPPVSEEMDYDTPEWMEMDGAMDIDIPRQIPDVTLNGGPVFEDDFDE